MADRKDIAELAKILHEKGYTVDSLKATVGRRFDDGGQTPPDTMTEEEQSLVNEWQRQHSNVGPEAEGMALSTMGNAIADGLYPARYDGTITSRAEDHVNNILGGNPWDNYSNPMFWRRAVDYQYFLNMKNALGKSTGSAYLQNAEGLKLKNPMFLSNPNVESKARDALNYYNNGIPIQIKRVAPSKLTPGNNAEFSPSSPYAIRLSDEDLTSDYYKYHEYSHAMDYALGTYLKNIAGVTPETAAADYAAGVLLGPNKINYNGDNWFKSYLTSPSETVARLHHLRQLIGADVNKRNFTAAELRKLYNDNEYLLIGSILGELKTAYSDDFDAIAKALNETYSEGGKLKTGNQAKYLAEMLQEKGYTAADLRDMKTSAGDGSADSDDPGMSEEPLYGGEIAPAIVKPTPVSVDLVTYPISRDYPITHSELYSLTYPVNLQRGIYHGDANRHPVSISKSMKDPTYNLVTNNCSDDTGRFLGDAFHTDFIKGITTPEELRKDVIGYLDRNDIPYNQEEVGNATYTTIQIPWYDYRKAVDKYNDQMMSRAQEVAAALPDSDARDAKLREAQRFKDQPRLQWHLDADGNVVNGRSAGGFIRRFDVGGLRPVGNVLSLDDLRLSSQPAPAGWGALLPESEQPHIYRYTIQRGDTLMMSAPDAELFTNNNYKMMYPHGNGFNKGGYVSNKFDTGGDTSTEPAVTLTLPEVVVTPNGNYVNYTGAESAKPSLSDFVETRQEGARVRAVNSMLNTEHPIVPAVPSKLARCAIRFGVPEKHAVKLFGYANSPHTCIATTTSQFGDPEAYVPGNITFDNNRTGFIQVGDYDYLPGDLINLYADGTPYHSTMVTGIIGDQERPYTLSPILTYSNGGIDRGDNLNMRYNKDNLYDDGDETTLDFAVEPDNLGKNTYKVFRYVGSPSMLYNWMNEYRRLYSPTGEVRNPDSRQSIMGYRFETTPDGKLRVTHGK